MIIVQAKVNALVKTAIDEENVASAGTDRYTSTGSPDIINDAEVHPFEDAFFPVRCLFAPKAQKGIDKGKKATRF